jgi:hypothetical protein
MYNHKYLEPEQKALEINLDEMVYGSFAEIGAGQEVARYFFQAGGAAGTIAKTMSAYDKIVSDKIYGPEEKGRYVCESRLYKMLDHEYELLINRLTDERPATCYFAFADTIAAINYHKTIIGNGWMGLRFQLEPMGQPNDLVLHVRMLDNDYKLQQQAIGILGVNMIYACFRYHNNIPQLIKSLIENLQDRVKIDMLRLSGPEFHNLDNRLVALELVKNKMSDVVMFGPDGIPQHASEKLYKRSILVVRGSWLPPTLVNMDILTTATKQFQKDPNDDSSRVKVLCELTIDNLKLNGDIDDTDYLERVDVLCKMGHTVIISDCEEYRKMIAYFNDYNLLKIGIVLGSQNLMNLLDKNYREHVDGSLLMEFGNIFTKKVKLYIYPSQQEGSDELLTSKNLALPDGLQFLYKHLLAHQQIEDIEGFNPDLFHIFSKDVLAKIRTDAEGWDKMVPDSVARIIRDKCYFGYPCQRLEFEY